MPNLKRENSGNQKLESGELHPKSRTHDTAEGLLPAGYVCRVWKEPRRPCRARGSSRGGAGGGGRAALVSTAHRLSERGGAGRERRTEGHEGLGTETSNARF